MRLLLLLLNILLMIISGYNLANEFSAPPGSDYLIFMILHMVVLGLSLTFSVLILRPVFSPEITDDIENEEQDCLLEEELTINHI